ncbi:MAG: PEGA domain-containing protein [bacterium]|nr:PEGA domain-containing protein [bacterium]MDZ4247969.1 PEGA domain-containing protein [Patescibacteria group bacterium]
METKTKPKHRVPLYKRRKFWGAVLLASVLSAGTALFFFVQETPLKEVKVDGRGVLSIDTDPDDATILVDGKERSQRTDSQFTLPTGDHKITLRLAGYDEAIIPIEIADTNTKDNPVTIEHAFTKQGLTPVEEPVSEFKTYTNGTYGYTLRYPRRWKVVEHGPDNVIFTDPKAPGGQGEEGEERAPLTVLALDNPRSLGAVAWYKAREEYPDEDQSLIKQKKVTVNGLTAYRYETPYGFVPYLITVVTEGDKAFLFQQIQDSPNRKLYDQTLGTLTF